MELKDFDTLTEAQGCTEAKGRMISPDMMLTFLAKNGVIDVLYIDANSSGLAKALSKAFQFGSEFNLMNGHPKSIGSMLDVMISLNELTQAFKDECVAYANPVIYPFANATLAQFNMAKKIYTAKPISFTQGKDVIITVNTALPERVAATVWRVENGFEPENAGRNIHVQDAIKYRIDMRGKESATYEIRIPLLDADFTVESV